MKNLAAVILAAGKGTRMKSELPKVIHEICGRPMLAWVIDSAREAGAGKLIVVVGHQAELLREQFSGQEDIVFVEQAEQLGTGHAVACALPALAGFVGTVLILCGDVPLVTGATLRRLVAVRSEGGGDAALLTARVADPFGYGRILRDEAGLVARIVEEKDASPVERAVTEINSGLYCLDADFLARAVPCIGSDNAQGEYYLTDIVPCAAAGQGCLPVILDDAEQILGVNDRSQLATAAGVLRRRINEALMLAGVSLLDPAATYIDPQVGIGRDTVIYPNVHLAGATVIGEGCVIEPGVMIRDCRIGDRVTVKAGSVLTESIVHEEVTVGPMAHLRPGSELMPHVKIGNFVETKKIVMGEGSKASHLTYLGDAEIGRDVNIGCGTITCNYDGVKKHKTVIGDGVFVGSDVQLVAPVTVGRNSLIAAGTTVTQNVPPDSLAIARTPQVNKEGWRLRKK